MAEEKEIKNKIIPLYITKTKETWNEEQKKKYGDDYVSDHEKKYDQYYDNTLKNEHLVNRDTRDQMHKYINMIQTQHKVLSQFPIKQYPLSKDIKAQVDTGKIEDVIKTTKTTYNDTTFDQIEKQIYEDKKSLQQLQLYVRDPNMRNRKTQLTEQIMDIRAKLDRMYSILVQRMYVQYSPEHMTSRKKHRRQSPTKFECEASTMSIRGSGSTQKKHKESKQVKQSVQSVQSTISNDTGLLFHKYIKQQMQ